MIELLDTNDAPIVVDEGESANIVATFHFADQAFNKAALLTLTLTLYDLATGLVINSRLGQDIRDANGGAVDVDGELTMELDADDNAVLDTDLTKDQVETHVARITWTWNDGDSVRTGLEEFTFGVRKLQTVVEA